MVAAFVFGCSGTIGAECDAADLAVVTTPAPTLYASELRRHQQQVSQPDGADVLVLGDSLTQRWTAEWTDGVFPGQHVALFGVRSDRMQNLLWRLPEIARAQTRPRTVVLWIGTNNLMIGDKDCALVAGMTTLVGAVRSAWPGAQLLVVGIAPHGAFYRDKDRLTVNAALREHQFGDGYRYVGIDALACPESAMPVGGLKPPLCNRYRPDNVHLDTLGYDIVSAAIRDTGLTVPR